MSESPSRIDLNKPIEYNKSLIVAKANKFNKLKTNPLNYLFDFVSVEQIFLLAITLRNKRLLKLAKSKNM